MKKVLLYPLLSILLINNISFNQFFKIPVLISHYLEHKQRNKSIDFIDFLSMHYWGKDMNDNDQDRDMQLPFKKTPEQTCFQIAIPFQKITHEKQVFVVIHTIQLMHPDEHITNQALHSVFRPPKG